MVESNELSTASQTDASKVCVIVATRGRPAIVARTIACLQSQTLRPALVVVSCVTEEDCGLADRANVIVVRGPAGLTRQRNTGLAQVPADTDMVVFFDDDFVPHRAWLANAAQAFADHPDIVGLSGNVVADGIGGEGLTFEYAELVLQDHAPEAHRWIRTPHSPYGCNMAFAWRRVADLRFDERLVLYGWQEDRDFGARVSRRGRVVKLGSALGVHLGVRGGRMPGARLGYSQVVNPLYLWRKGTMQSLAVLDHLARNIGMNAVRSIRPENHIDRRGRLRGNLMGLRDAARGSIAPERALEME